MEEIISSDLKINPTMHAIESFNHILQQVQNSCLNFHLQISPFSAVISIKKSLIRDKSGNFMLPPPTLFQDPNKKFEELADKNLLLEKDLISINKKYENAINDCSKANQLIKSLEKQKTETEIKVEEARNTNEKILLLEIDQLKNALAERDEEISFLNKSNVSAKEALERLNKALHENSKKFKEEKAQLLEEKRAELKSWKNKFGEANSQILKLEKKIKVLEDTCTHELSVTQPLFPTPGQADPSPTSPSTPPRAPSSTPPPCSPPAQNNASDHHPCSAAVGPGQPSPPEPGTPRTLPASPSNLRPQTSITVQAKLKEAISSGKKLPYENLLALLESHPWETETEEPFEYEDEYAEYHYDDFDYESTHENTEEPV